MRINPDFGTLGSWQKGMPLRHLQPEAWEDETPEEERDAEGEGTMAIWSDRIRPLAGL